MKWMSSPSIHATTFKTTAHASERDRPDVAVRRQAWFVMPTIIHAALLLGEALAVAIQPRAVASSLSSIAYNAPGDER
jgi:hypothetical protein